MADAAKQSQHLRAFDRNGAPWWLVAVLLGGVGVGGAVGGVQFGHAQPQSGAVGVTFEALKNELEKNTAAVQQQNVRLESLTGAVASLAAQTGRDQMRSDKSLDDHENRIRALEGRRPLPPR